MLTLLRAQKKNSSRSSARSVISALPFVLTRSRLSGIDPPSAPIVSPAVFSVSRLSLFASTINWSTMLVNSPVALSVQLKRRTGGKSSDGQGRRRYLGITIERNQIQDAKNLSEVKHDSVLALLLILSLSFPFKCAEHSTASPRIGLQPVERVGIVVTTIVSNLLSSCPHYSSHPSTIVMNNIIQFCYRKYMSDKVILPKIISEPTSLPPSSYSIDP